MTQEQLDTLIEVWCLTAQESLGDYGLDIEKSEKFTDSDLISMVNKNIYMVDLPYEYIRKAYTPKEKAKIVISLLEQIRDNGDQWLRDEENYHADKLAEKGDNDYKSRLENN